MILSTHIRRRLTPPNLVRAFATHVPPSRHILSAAVILNRSPIITRTPTPLERAYYAYQARIQRALHNPFPYDFYFKQGSPIEAQFSVEERRRERKAYGKPFGTEEDVGGSEPGGEGEKQAGAKVGLDETQQESDDTSTSRIHPSDIKSDVKSLDRKGQRNLYLLLKEINSQLWRFPHGGVDKTELLHQAAERDLYAACGSAMDTWIVSRKPIGIYIPPSSAAALGANPNSPPISSNPQDMTFFFKAHIMAGQVRPNPTLATDFAWLTKEEIEERIASVDTEYWKAVKDVLSDF